MISFCLLDSKHWSVTGIEKLKFCHAVEVHGWQGDTTRSNPYVAIAPECSLIIHVIKTRRTYTKRGSKSLTSFPSNQGYTPTYILHLPVFHQSVYETVPKLRHEALFLCLILHTIWHVHVHVYIYICIYIYIHIYYSTISGQCPLTR